MPMILHSASPYTVDIPNPALGYLKGFLKRKGIDVHNIYWNLVLYREISNFNKDVEHTHSLSVDAVTVYTWKQLAGYSTITTPLDYIFQSVLTKDELCELVQSVKDKIDRFISEKRLHEADIAGFTMKTYQWLMNSYIMSRLKEMNPDMKIVIGGISTEDQGRALMRMVTKADFAIWGEGEYPLVHLIQSLEENNTLQDVPNLIYRDGKNLSSTNPLREYPPLDEYPFADHSDYFDAVTRFMPANMQVLIPVWGSRSCPWNKCKFCVLNEEYSYRTRSPENIVEEIEYQSQKYGTYTFIFVDTEIAGNKKRLKTLLTLLVKASSRQKEPYHFFAEISPVFIDTETAKLMQVASFTSIQVGFEAMTDSLLEKMEKRHTFAHNMQALKLGNQYGLYIDGLNIIRGTPPETKEDILESCKNVKFVRFLLNKYVFRPASLELYKGSPFYEEMPEEERKLWRYHRFWEEIAPLKVIPEEDRFEFFGFFRNKPDFVWDDFESVRRALEEQNRSYTWIEYEDGSFVEEKGPGIYKYVLDRDETDILIFCDLIKSFSEVKKQFSHINEDNLRELLSSLKDFGLIYYDKDMHTIISVLEACRRNRTF